MNQKKNILSLFDGMSCGQLALKKTGIKYDKYFASEVDSFAIKVTQSNFPETIQVGDVRNLKAENLPEIFLLQGGSPCQSFSFAGKRKGMSTKDNVKIISLNQYLKLKEEEFEFEGQSYLFWEFVRLLKEVKPKFFFLENVVMTDNWKNLISQTLGVNPIQINSSLVSAQNRNRLYWTNIGMIPSGLFDYEESIVEQPKDLKILLKNILEHDVDDKYYLSKIMVNSFKENTIKFKSLKIGYKFTPTEGNEKSKTLTIKPGQRMCDNFILIHEANNKGFVKINVGDCFDNENKSSKTRRGRLMTLKSNCVLTKKTEFMYYENNEKIRRLTPIECERLQTVPDNYTNHVSDTQRYKMIGNGWTVDVICHIYSYIK